MPGRKKSAAPEQKPNRTILGRTLFLLTVCGVAAFAVLVARLYKIQVVQHDEYESLALEQQTREATITASRGAIYDVNGKALAISASVETVFVSPYETRQYGEDKELIASNLAAILEVDRDSVLTKLNDTASWYKTIRTKIESDLAERVREFIKENNLKSVHLEPDSKRYYPYSSLACQVIGFVGTDNIGLEGLEAQLNPYLTGTNGRIVRLKNANGTDMLFTDFEDYYDARDGGDVTLTIDSTIQYYVEKRLAQAIEDYAIQKGAACIAMRPKTGEVLAMASFGNYDLNNYLELDAAVSEQLSLITDEEERKTAAREALYAQWRNKSLSDTYEPGSVFKIITLAMALEEGIVDENSTFFCGGSLTGIPGRKEPLNCWKHAGHGTQTLSEAMQNSCNVALVSIGLRVGAETFYKYIDAFGFFDKTGFDLPGEGSSLWWPESLFYDQDNKSQLGAASYGQTFNITPLQMVTAISAAVNGGNLVQPHVVKQIADQEGNIVTANDTTVVRQVISERTSAQIREILEDVVKTGTGANAYVKGYRVGGKTGTSEKTAENLQKPEGAPKDYIVSFCGIAPIDDPEIVVLLLLDTPSSETGLYISGGVMAAPVAGGMMSDILPYLGIQPQYTPEEINELNVSVPKLTGKSLSEAESALSAQGLTYRTVGDGGDVTDQLPAANAVVSPGTKVILYTGGTQPDAGTVTAPDLTDKSYQSAKAALEAEGLFIRSTGALSSLSGVAVSMQSIPPGGEAAYGSVIEVTLVDKSIQGNY
ncbi:MAG: PASTA domain-containing protein [Oscillospiraceae bacterium]|jgi:stage V sporulation protein D (sporulation-specific penicillin-binding protein)|nr:PASTA domain-containing protein [Oscillospiraceae bacterium]